MSEEHRMSTLKQNDIADAVHAKLVGRSRIIEFTPAFDRRHADGNKNYGIHGVEMRMVLKGRAGAVQFVLFTDWHLPHVRKEHDNKCRPLPADLGYHSRVPRYSDQKAQPNCEYLDGCPCYYDGSGLNAEKVFNTLTEEGSEGVWRKLEAYYREIFNEDP